MFKSEKPEGGNIKEVMENKKETDRKEAQAKIDYLAFQKALLEIIDNLGEEEIKKLEEEAENLSQEEFSESIKKKYPNFNNRLTEIKTEIITELENSLEKTNEIDTDLAGRTGEIAFTGAMNEIIATADDSDIDALNTIMGSQNSLEEKMRLVEKKIPDFQEILNKKSLETADDLKRLTQMTLEKVAKIKKEKGIE